MTTTATRRRSRSRIADRPRGGGGPFRARTLGDRVKLVVAGALVGVLVYYVGPREIGETLLKIVVAVGLSAALFVGANKLFDLAYDGVDAVLRRSAASPSASS